MVEGYPTNCTRFQRAYTSAAAAKPRLGTMSAVHPQQSAWTSAHRNSAVTSILPTMAALNDGRSSAGIRYSRCSRPPACSTL